MKKKSLKDFYIGSGLILVFVLWTVLLSCVDVKPIGPNGSKVGLATINGFFHNLTGVNMTLYNITDWLGLVPMAFAFGFAIMGLIQLIKRKHILKVDYSLLVLGGFYIVVIAIYFMFETVVTNYRPVLIDGYLEASYPSSTTVLVLCVIPTTKMQLRERIKHEKVRHYVNLGLSVFIAFMVVGRLISGVHWITDIIGGILISSGLVMLYRFLSGKGM